MSEDKGVLRLQIIHEIGVELDDNLEVAKLQSMQEQGALAGAQKCRQLVEGLLPHVDKDVDTGSLTLEQASLVKKWLTRSVLAVEGAITKYEQQCLVQRGRVDALLSTVERLKKKHLAEQNKQAILQELSVTGEGAALRRIPLKQRRLAESSAAEPSSTEGEGPDASNT